jgi:putative ABC transport system permease protein
MLRDLRYALRTWLKKPAFAGVIVLTLALGIGANTAIFSVVNAILLKPLPFHRADRIALLWGDDRANGNHRGQMSNTDINDYRAQKSVLEAASTYSGWNPLLTGGGEPERVNGALVGDDFFKVLGTHPMLGREFLTEEQQDGKDQVVILSNELWRVRFGGDPTIVGKTILLNLRPHTVVGILPADFRPLPSTLIDKPAKLYRPAAEVIDDKQRSARHLRGIARLRDGVTFEQAQAELSLVASRLEQQHPESNTNSAINVVPLYEDTVKDLRPTLWLLLGAVGFVLLIACANVANLLLARATLRAPEMSIRTALGASRRRLIRQALTESALLAVVGGGLGCLLAVWGIGVLKTLAGRLLPQLTAVEIDLRVLGFTLLLSLLTGIIFGLVPALQASRPDLNDVLKEAGRGGFVVRSRLRSVIVTAQIAFALVLLICAGLLIRSVSRLRSVDPGLSYTNVLKMDLGLPSIKYSNDEKRIGFYRKLTERVRQLPGVVDAAVVTPLPISTGFDQTSFDVEGQPTVPGQEPDADRYIVTPGYFHTLGIPLRNGRELTENDREGAAPVLVVSEKFAEKFWPHENPIGKHIRLPWNPGREDAPWRTVVGVVGDVKQYGLDKPSSVALYLPHAQHPVSFMSLVTRTESAPESMIGAVRQTVRSLDADQVPTDSMTMEQLLAESIQLRRFSMLLLGVFAALALVLAAVGIYGVMSYSVSQRTHEIGIRMALGAQATDLMRLVMGNGLLVIGSGIVIGVVAALGLTRLMQSLLFGVTATDITTFVMVSGGLIVVALLACYLPARRAAKVDPLTALRNE